MVSITQYQYTFYIIALICGIISGIYTTVAIPRYTDEKTVFSKESLKILKGNIPKFVIFSLLSIIGYILIIKQEVYNLMTIDYKNMLSIIQRMILIPLLLITFVTDVKDRIIPNRITMLLFQTGILFAVLNAINLNGPLSVSIELKESVMGMFIAFAIFELMVLLGGLIAGKEAMGMGDVKFMTPIGLFFGIQKTLDITLGAFLLSTIFAIVIMIYRKIRKIEDEYIPFGPFLVISIILMIFLPSGYIINHFFAACSLVSEQLLHLIK